ncbi:MAG: hypothetical protein P4L53_07310 [Candidatus Obscuribacterales bacterium]|nr:hypothetical protein [Candidatus Obscuribacterales bacterium]
MSDNVTDKTNAQTVDPKSKDRPKDHDDSTAKAKADAAKIAAEKAEAAQRAAEKTHQSMIAEAMAAMRHLLEESKTVLDKRTDADHNNQKLIDAGKLPQMAVPAVAAPEATKTNPAEITKTAPVDITRSTSPTDAIAKSERSVENIKPYDKPLTAEQKYFTDFYQQRLSDPAVLAQITPEPAPKPGQSPADADAAYQKTLVDRANAIKSEMGAKDSAGENWVKQPAFGPATQAAFRDYSDWLQKIELPNQARELQSTGKEPPPGSPISVPIENGKPIPITEYQNRIATGKLAADLHIDSSKPPDQAESERLENALTWRNQAKDTNDTTRGERFDSDVAQRIKELGLPSGWQYQPGQDKAAWRQAASQMIDLTEHVGRMANLVNKLKLPVDQPPGSSVTTGKDGTHIKLDLPQNLRLDDPQTLEKVRALQQWETKVTPSLETVRTQLDAVAKDPKKALAWGDTVIQKVKDASGKEVSATVQLDKDGKLINIVDPTKPELTPGAHTEKANLLAERFTAKTDPKTGEIVVTQDVQAQKVPWYSYENMIYSNVGKPADLPEKRYKPDDLVAVNKGSGTEFMLARDLESYEKTSAALHYGEKALMATMDVAMVATGTIEVGAAIKGARLLVAAGELAADVSARDVAKAGAKGVWDLALGAGGITSSAEVQSSTFGRELSQVRNTAFMGTLGVGAIKPGLRAFRFITKGTGTAKTFEAVSEEAGQATETVKATEVGKPTKEGAEDTPKSQDATPSPAKAGETIDLAHKATEAKTLEAQSKPAEVIKNADGSIKSTAEGDKLSRQFEYAKDGKLDKLTVKSESGNLVMERVPGEEHVWNVKAANGRESKLEGDITTNADGSYTVTQTTDAKASWYSKAFGNNPPTEPLEKAVTYHPDGSITTKGIDADFKPAEGSAYRKEAHDGEYWTSPEGKQNWIDGSKILWENKAPGLWQSQDGLMTEHREFVKKASISASKLTEPLNWTDTYNGVETEKVAKAGDMKVDEGNGKFYVIDAEKFKILYQDVPGQDGVFVKKDFARAREITTDGEVKTSDGSKMAKAGDYISYSPDGKEHLVEKEAWDKLYRENHSVTESNEATKPFALPEATGPVANYKDGTVSFPYKYGKVTWNADHTMVAITDERSGKPSFYNSVENDTVGTRFNFNNGSEVRIEKSGLRMIHTPDMGEGVFKGEDGSILKDVGKTDVPVKNWQYQSPTELSMTVGQLDVTKINGVSPEEIRLDYSRYSQANQAATIAKLEQAPIGTNIRDMNGVTWTNFGGRWIDSDTSIKDLTGVEWTKSGDNWLSKNGTMSVTQDGIRITNSDGSGNWADSNGRQWHREASDPPKQWRSKDGATYTEGTWDYIKRTKNDPQVAAVLKGLQGAGIISALHPQTASAASLDASGNPIGEKQTVDASGNPVGEKAAVLEGQHVVADGGIDKLKGPVGKAVEDIAHKAMAYTTYPIIAQQLGDIAAQGKQVTGQALQSLGFQLNQMWAPTNDYAAAAAMVDYTKGQEANLPEPAALSAPQSTWHPAAPIQSDKAVADTIAEYKNAITQNIPETWWGGNPTKNSVDQIFDKLAHAVSPAGTEEERAKFKKELATNIAFNSQEISLLDRINGRPITSQEAQDLMDPAKRINFSNKNVAKVAERMMGNRDQTIVEASSAALIFMADQTKNQDPNSLAKTTVSVYPQLETSPFENAQLVGKRDFELNLSADYLTGNLKHALAQTSNDARSMAYGDLLVKNGEIAPQEFGAILQNVLSNPKSTADEKMHALSDANGPRMGALISGLVMQASGAANASTNNFGSTLQDFESTLSNTALNDTDASVRAMSAAMVFSISRFKANPTEGAKFMDQLSALRSASENAAPGLNNSLADNARALISSELAKTPASDVQGSLDAAQAYALLESHVSPADKKNMESQISKTLIAALPNADAQQADNIAASLLPDRLRQLNQSAPELADAARQQIISKLIVPSDYSEDTEKLMVATLSKMPQLLDGASQTTRNQLFDAAKQLVENADPAYTKLRPAAVNAIKDAATSGSASTLRQMAESEQSPAVRLSALQALEAMHDPKLLTIVSNRLGDGRKGSEKGGIETDPDVVAHLQDMQYRLKEAQVVDESGEKTVGTPAQPNPVLSGFQSSISERYPLLNTFDAEKQKAWVSENFPLLVKDNFKTAVQAATDGKQSLWFSTADKAADKVDDQRQAQFDQLVKTAGADANLESTQQARRVLASIVAQNGGLVGHSESISTGSYSLPNGDDMTTTEIPTEYKEKPHDWAAAAATALAKTANIGYTGRDLTAGLIGSILADNPPPAVRESLNRAWDLLAYSGNGTLVPRPVYDYVRRLTRS